MLRAMFSRKLTAMLAAVVMSAACTTVRLGGPANELILKRFEPRPGVGSLYICREQAAFLGVMVNTVAVVDGSSVATLRPNTFAHQFVPPGTHQILVRQSNQFPSGVLEVDVEAGEVVFVWVGMAGPFAPLTVDFFRNDKDGRQCVKKASYAIRSD